MWPEQKRSGHISFRECFRRIFLTLCAHGASAARSVRVRVDARDRSTRPCRARRRSGADTHYCVMRISLFETINVHGKPMSESGSRATKLLVTMLMRSPRCSPVVIVHSSATPSSRCSAEMMNASYVPSRSVVMIVTRVVDARTSSAAHARLRASVNSRASRATSGGCHARCVTNA